METENYLDDKKNKSIKLKSKEFLNQDKMAFDPKSAGCKGKDGWEKKASALGKLSISALIFSIFRKSADFFYFSSSSEKEVKILNAKVEEFEGLEKMFMELLKMCEQFDARVRMLEDQLVQVKETRDTFLKEISAKHEDFIRKLADSQEALIKEAVDRKISSLENEGKRCNLGKSSPSKSSPNIESTVAAESLASKHLVEGGGGSPKVKSLTDKTNSSRLSPSAPEFVLPSMNSIPSGQQKNAPSYAMPTIPGYQVYQDPKLIFQQSGRSQNPNIQHPSFEPPSIQSLRLQNPPGWYIGNPVMSPPVIVPNVSSAGFPSGPMLMQAYLKNPNK